MAYFTLVTVVHLIVAVVRLEGYWVTDAGEDLLRERGKESTASTMSAAFLV